MACAYAESADFFLWLREYRDNLIHGGTSFDWVFVLSEGFGVFTDRPPFDSLDIWNDVNLLQNKIGSLISVAAHVIQTTFQLVETIIVELPRAIQFAPTMAPGYGVFLHGYHIREAGKLSSYISERPWYGA